jgi:hypothetical protein
MGYPVYVQPVDMHVATCCVTGCDFEGTVTTEDQAQADADAHRAEHSRRDRAEDEAISRTNNRPDPDLIAGIRAGTAQPPFRVGDQVRLPTGTEGSLARWSAEDDGWHVDLEDGTGLYSETSLVWLSDGSVR